MPGADLWPQRLYFGNVEVELVPQCANQFVRGFHGDVFRDARANLSQHSSAKDRDAVGLVALRDQVLDEGRLR